MRGDARSVLCRLSHRKNFKQVDGGAFVKNTIRVREYVAADMANKFKHSPQMKVVGYEVLLFGRDT
jgi:hypothetical protein